jgi:hypothetical protein
MIFDHEDRQLIRELIRVSVGNAQALADLTAAVTALTAAVANAPQDISDGVEAQVADINAATTALGGTPPSEAAASDTTATPQPVPSVPVTA